MLLRLMIPLPGGGEDEHYPDMFHDIISYLMTTGDVSSHANEFTLNSRARTVSRAKYGLGARDRICQCRCPGGK